MDTSRNAADPSRYVRPSARMDRWFQVVVRWFTQRGVSLMGSRVLTVRGRKSGQPRQVVVNLLSLDGQRYLVSPRGNTEWVRNVRAAGTAELTLGHRTEHVALTELPVEEQAEAWGALDEQILTDHFPIIPTAYVNRLFAFGDRVGNPTGEASMGAPNYKDLFVVP